MGAIVRDENLSLVIRAHSIRELEVTRARELLEDRSVHVEDDDTHHLNTLLVTRVGRRVSPCTPPR